MRPNTPTRVSFATDNLSPHTCASLLPNLAVIVKKSAKKKKRRGNHTRSWHASPSLPIVPLCSSHLILYPNCPCLGPADDGNSSGHVLCSHQELWRDVRRCQRSGVKIHPAVGLFATQERPVSALCHQMSPSNLKMCFKSTSDWGWGRYKVYSWMDVQSLEITEVKKYEHFRAA